MEFINKIGLRNTAKYLVMISVVIAVSIYGLKFMNVGDLASNQTLFKSIFGTVMFSLSNLILYFIANKSREYRTLAVFSSALVTFINTVLFVLTIFNREVYILLFFVSLLEILITGISLIIVSKLESKQKKDIARK